MTCWMISHNEKDTVKVAASSSQCSYHTILDWAERRPLLIALSQYCYFHVFLDLTFFLDCVDLVDWHFCSCLQLTSTWAEVQSVRLIENTCWVSIAFNHRRGLSEKAYLSLFVIVIAIIKCQGHSTRYQTDNGPNLGRVVVLLFRYPAQVLFGCYYIRTEIASPCTSENRVKQGAMMLLVLWGATVKQN